MLSEVFAEGLGTFFFLGVILASGGNVVTIAVGLAAAIYLVSKFSAANLNPVVSIVLFAKGDLTGIKCAAYIVAQIIGGLLALVWHLSTLVAIKG